MGERAVELRAIGHRARQVGLLAVLTGALTGLGVAGIDRLVNDGIFERLLDAPLWLQAVGPALGLTAAALALRWLARGASPATADEYIKDFHDPEQRLDPRRAPGRLVASAATLGGGAAMGFEGPSIYLGAVIGSWLQHRFSRFFARTDTEVLLVCGAAAGVAAIFKAPATGVVPDDDYLLALARDSGADRLVTGDPDLLEIVEPPLLIVSPGIFVAELLGT